MQQYIKPIQQIIWRNIEFSVQWNESGAVKLLLLAACGHGARGWCAIMGAVTAIMLILTLDEMAVKVGHNT